MDDLPVARLREIDYDARREPRTARHCVHCQRDLSPDAYVRFGRVLIVGGLPIFTIHPDDVHAWRHRVMRIALPGDYQLQGVEDLGWKPFGLSCARRHGIGWTIPEDPSLVRPRLLRAGQWRFGPLLVARDDAGRWGVYAGDARTAGDQIGWFTDTLAEAVEQARVELPLLMPIDTRYRGEEA